MARLAIAAVVVLILVAAASAVMTRLARSTRSDGPGTNEIPETQMQKVAFFLLIALIMYVSVSGGV